MSTNYYVVESEDQDYWKGVFLGKRAGGWVFQIKWHDYKWCDCECEDETHIYRNFDELREWLIHNGKVVKNEYGEVINAKEFIDMVENWTENNMRRPTGDSHWQIDDYSFVRGNWS